jgi:hypothetical protein
MKLPPHYLGHLDHRITCLLSFILRRDGDFFGACHGEEKQMGDLYRSSLEGAGIMLRALIEFLGAKPFYRRGHLNFPLTLIEITNPDVGLGSGDLAQIEPLDLERLDPIIAARLAWMHDGVSKRSGHSAFNMQALGLDPEDLEWAAIFVVTEIWNRCYKPDPISIHQDIYAMLSEGEWAGVQFKKAG